MFTASIADTAAAARDASNASPETPLHLLRHAQICQRHTAQPNVYAPACHIPVLQCCHFHLLNKASQHASLSNEIMTAKFVELPRDPSGFACMHT
jgi:hypothetical protein